MKPKKEKTTVLFVNKNAKGIKPMRISSGLLLNWKKYLAGLILIFGTLVWVIFHLASHNIQQEQKQVTLSEKLKNMHALFSTIDTNAMRKKFTKIDKDLSKINGYLKARGIVPAFKGGEGGEADDDIISSEEISGFYDNYLNKIAYNIAYTPLGYPYYGAITSTFGHRENPFGGGHVETHKGVDIRAPYGASVKAMAKGTVVFAGRNGGFGNCIKIKHAHGFVTLYGHLSKIMVKVGQEINIGEQIGKVGSTGRSTGPHLHYTIYQYGKKIDPQPFLTLK